MSAPAPDELVEFDSAISGTGLIAVPPAALARLAGFLGRRPDPGYRVRVTLTLAPPSAVIRAEVPPQARPAGHLYVHEVQLDGDEDLLIGTELDVIDEGGNELAAVVEDIGADEHGPVYRIRLTPHSPDAVVGDRRATPAEVRAHAAALQVLANQHGFARARVRPDGVVVLSTGGGHWRLGAFTAAAADLVGAHVHVQTDQPPLPPGGRPHVPNWPAPGVRQVTRGEIDALAAMVAAFEASWGVSSSAMFDVEDRLVASLEETEELHAWAAAWTMLNALDPTRDEQED